MKINFKIVTPQRTVLEKEVDQVSIPTKVGEVTLLPNHIDYITLIAPGIVEAKNDSELTSMTISEGFLEFHDNELTVLANTAEKAEEIDLVRAEEARNRAEKMIQEKTRLLNEEQYAAVISRVEKQTARVKLAKRYHPRTSRR